MENKQDINYYYVQPTATVANIGMVIIIIVFFLFIIFKLLFISINWESEKCRNSNFFIAPLLGQDGETTFKQCANDAMKSALNDTGTEYYKKLNTLTTNVSQIPAVTSSGSSGSSSTTDTQFSTNYNSLLSTIHTTQTALSKILGSIVLSSYLNKGVLQSTNNLQNSELTNLIDQYNTIGQNINDQQQRTSIMSNM
jgi:hypothetical protein